MKVGTDGVLLGAWAKIKNTMNALDIGTGTGLIALMLAQRNSSIIVDAIEVEAEAYKEAEKNIANSPWAERINIFRTSLQEFRTSVKYDLVVSNPPYFENSIKNESNSKTLARHTDSLSPTELINHTEKLLSNTGIFCVIIPYESTHNFIEIAKAHKLFLNRRVLIKGTISAPIKRVLLEFSRTELDIQDTELIIEKSRHVYTREFTELLKDFYLYL